MSYCAVCGAKLKEGAKVCPVCGAEAKPRRDPGAEARWQAFTDVPFDDADFEILPAAGVNQIPAQPAERPEGSAPAQPLQGAAPVSQDRAAPAARQQAYGGAYTYTVPRPPQPEEPPSPAPAAEPADPPRQSAGRSAPTGAPRRSARRPGGGAAALKERAGSTLERLRESRVFADAGVIGGAILKGSTPAAKKVRTALAITLGAVVLLFLLLRVTASTGERGVAKKLARAYSSRNTDQVIALGSDLMRGLDTENGTYEQACRSLMDQLHGEFTAAVGERYHVSYKIRIRDNIKGQTLRTRLIGSFGDAGAAAFDDGRVTELTAVSLNLRASHGGNSIHKRINLMLIKENGKWRLASQLI